MAHTASAAGSMCKKVSVAGVEDDRRQPFRRTSVEAWAAT
jgi:hypothetical protein